MDTKSTITRNDRVLTPLEALFAEVGLPAREVAACPDPACERCRRPLPQAA
jgi:hypothetical protein